MKTVTKNGHKIIPVFWKHSVQVGWQILKLIICIVTNILWRETDFLTLELHALFTVFGNDKQYFELHILNSSS
jgi:hypothetical protein